MLSILLGGTSLAGSFVVKQHRKHRLDIELLSAPLISSTPQQHLVSTDPAKIPTTPAGRRAAARSGNTKGGLQVWLSM